MFVFKNFQEKKFENSDDLNSSSQLSNKIENLLPGLFFLCLSLSKLELNFTTKLLDWAIELRISIKLGNKKSSFFILAPGTQCKK